MKIVIVVFNESVVIYGCVGRFVDYDECFIVVFVVEVKNYIIECNDIKIDEVCYLYFLLCNICFINLKVEVWIEFENFYVVYVYVNNKWVSCVVIGVVEFMEKIIINQQVEIFKICGVGILRVFVKVWVQDELVDLFDQVDKQLEQVKQVGWIDLNDVEFDDMDVSINIFEQFVNVEVQWLLIFIWSQL